MRFLVCQRRSEKPVDAREDGIDVFESDFLLIGVNVHVHIFRRHHDIQHVYRIAPFHQHSAVRLAGGNGNRIIDLEPRVNHSVESEKPDKTTPQENKIEQPAAVPSNVNENKENTAETAAQTPIREKEKEKQGHGFPFWILGVSGSIALLGILYLIFDAARHSADKDRSRLESFCNISAQNQVKRRKREYYDIVNNEELNWQEKYKLYNEKEDGSKPQKHIAAMSYVTDISGLKTPSGLAENTDSDLTPEQIAEKSELESHLSKDKFCKMVQKAKSYIQNGEVIQIVLSQKFSAPIHVSALDLYRALRLSTSLSEKIKYAVGGMPPLI